MHYEGGKRGLPPRAGRKKKESPKERKREGQRKKKKERSHYPFKRGNLTSFYQGGVNPLGEKEKGNPFGGRREKRGLLLLPSRGRKDLGGRGGKREIIIKPRRGGRREKGEKKPSFFWRGEKGREKEKRGEKKRTVKFRCFPEAERGKEKVFGERG